MFLCGLDINPKNGKGAERRMKIRLWILLCLLETFLWVKPQNGGDDDFMCFLCFVFRRSKVSSIYFMASHALAFIPFSLLWPCSFNVFESPSTTMPLFMCMWLLFCCCLQNNILKRVALNISCPIFRSALEK